MNASTTTTLWNGKTVPRIGIGTWVMGRAQRWGEQPTGWSGVDDTESLATLREAFDFGVRIIDAADSMAGAMPRNSSLRRCAMAASTAIASPSPPRSAWPATL